MIIILPADTPVLDAAQQAAAAHLHLITDGRRSVLSPIVLPGWHKLAVVHKPAQEVSHHGAAADRRLG